MRYCDNCGGTSKVVRTIGDCDVCGAEGVPVQGLAGDETLYLARGSVTDGRYELYGLRDPKRTQDYTATRDVGAV